MFFLRLPFFLFFLIVLFIFSDLVNVVISGKETRNLFISESLGSRCPGAVIY